MMTQDGTHRNRKYTQLPQILTETLKDVPEKLPKANVGFVGK